MKICGLTGGIGMGKTTTAQLLSRLGVRVVDTDDLARQLTRPGEAVLGEIQSAFGPGVIASDGQLRRDELARIVFADPPARQKLEQLLHPPIRNAWLARVETWRQQGHALAVVVIPLLFETNAESHFDKIICTACLPATQQERLAVRNWTPQHTAQRLAAQWPIEEKITRSDYVLWTEGRPESLVRQLERLLLSLKTTPMHPPQCVAAR
jgi:dephospho-CoA kinase